VASIRNEVLTEEEEKMEAEADRDELAGCLGIIVALGSTFCFGVLVIWWLI